MLSRMYIHTSPVARRTYDLCWVIILLSDGSEGLNAYVSTKWTQQEIEAAEKQRLDDIESTLSMRTGSSTFSRYSRTRPGVNYQNRIVHAM